MEHEKAARNLRRSSIAVVAALLLCAATVLAVFLTGAKSWAWSAHAPKPFALGEGTFSFVILAMLGLRTSEVEISLHLVLIDLLLLLGLGYGVRRGSRILATTMFVFFVIDHLLFFVFDFENWSLAGQLYWGALVLGFGFFVFQGMRSAYAYRGKNVEEEPS